MEHDVRADELAVVIPTRDRWEILRRTLGALRSQSVLGFETIVVVDGTDQAVPDELGARVLVQEHAGPGAARNLGARSTDRSLVLFLGDDMVPEACLVERHLGAHASHREPASAVLGRVTWHDDVGRSAIAKWLDWSGAQFDYENISGEDAGWGRLYSCNLSLKRSFFLEAGGFDESFTFDYEDLDLAWRLHQRGLRLWYEPAALARHLHAYDWDRLVRRYESRARGERLMQAKHDWFRPHFAGLIRQAASHRPVSRIWSHAADRMPDAPAPIQRRVRARANRWYNQQLAPRFLAAWEGQPALDELQSYLGDGFDIDLLRGHVAAVEREEEAAPDEATFYRTSRMYLYDLTAFAMTGTKRPYFADLRRFVPPAARILDYGCGIGGDGLALLAEGHQVAFADFANPSMEYLRWRLARRGLDAEVYDLDRDQIPDGFDAAYSLDVIEHVEDPFAFLDALEQRAAIVMVNLLEADPHDTHLHRPLPIAALLDHAASLGILRYRKYYSRSHLVIYRTRRPGLGGQVRSLAQRHLGALLPNSIRT